MPAPDRALLEAFADLAVEAGRAIMAVRAAGFAVDAKPDLSPVTEADRRAEEIILAALARLVPGVPVIAEEAVARGEVPAVGDAFFLVDPLDGTKDFVRGGPDFTVNIGLIQNGAAAAGVIHAPATGHVWVGLCGGGAQTRVAAGVWSPIRVRPAATPPDIIASRSHRNAATDAFIARYPGSRVVSAGSSLKFATVAEGRADLYPRLSPTSQWDTAAGDAILRAAGGAVRTLAGAPLPYGPLSGRTGAAAFENPSFVAMGEWSMVNGEW